jgi:hypothetical protein
LSTRDDNRILIPHQTITQAILLLRGQKVIIDEDLSGLYGVETRILVRNVKRNIERFPDDFMFQLNEEEFILLKDRRPPREGRGGRRYAPYAFTEQGVAMASSVLHSPQAIQVNIEIMRAFVRLREMLSTNKDLAKQLVELEKRYDERFRAVFEAIHAMMGTQSNTRPIGFARDGKDK